MAFNQLVIFCAFYVLPCISISFKTKNPIPDGRIIGGQRANIKDYPYHLSLLFRGKHICGAALIDKKWAVTAAHCVHGFEKSLLSIRAGTSQRNSGGEIYRIKYMYAHPRYASSIVDFDIALLELAEPVTTEMVKQIELPKEGSQVPYGVMATITGWGRQGEDDSLSDDLQVLRLPTLSREACMRSYGVLTQRMFCAGYQDSDKMNSCQGDSGGPLVINGILYGIVSWGYGCDRPGYPGVYSNIAILSRFIRKVAKFSEK